MSSSNWIRGAVIVLLLVLGGMMGCRGLLRMPYLREDPALMAPDPGAFRNDDWDRHAAKVVDASRGTQFLDLLAKPGTEREVVERLRATAAETRKSEALPGLFPDHAPCMLLIRRPRASYAVAAEAMAASDAASRGWGLGTFEVVEGRRRGGPSSEPPGPPYRGPERDAALAAVARLLTSDPDVHVRRSAICLVHDMLPDHDQPSVEAIAVTLAREEDHDARMRLVWLLAERDAPPSLILDAAMRGYHDPVTVSVGIYDLFVEENRTLLEKAYREGNAVGRAGIGEAFSRHQSAMPWAEALILQGLSDPDLDVRARFAKGTLVLKPPSASVRARLEGMADEVPNAAWALSVMDGDASEEER